MVLPACSVRTVLCTEDDSVLAWWAFFVGNIPLEKDSVFLFLFLYLLIAKLMYCHIRLMGLVAYQSPPSVCEHFNSNMENCMSKYQRVMPEVVAFFAEFLLGSYLPKTLPSSDKITFNHYLQHIKLA